MRHKTKNILRISAAVMTAGLLFAGCGAEHTDTGHEEAALSDTGSAGTVPEAKVSEEKETIDPERAAADSAVPGKKEELVSVQANETGQPEKIEVIGTLSGYTDEDGAYLSDISGLFDLKNSTGEEDFCTAEDGTVYWENLGRNIRYEGVSEEPLPVDVAVTYFLDGEQMTLPEIKGKSGSVKIRFDYTVRETAEVTAGEEKKTMTVPFLALSMAVLPDDTFSEVAVSHGKLISLGDMQAAVGLALPGLEDDLELSGSEITEDIELPSYVEITADAEDFDLEFTATLLKPGLFRDLDEDKLDSMEEETGEVDELEDAVKELEEAAGKLADGAAEMQESLRQYTDGVSQTAAAIRAMSQELAAYDFSALGQMGKPLQELQAGMAQLEQETAALPDAGKAICEGMTGLAEGTAEFRDGITTFNEEGIKELTGFFRDDLGGLADRIRAVHLADLQYRGYTPSFEEQDVDVSFLIETRGTK